jgi:hypothetical protein
MDLKETIERISGMDAKRAVVAWVGHDAERFKALLDLMLADNKKASLRAAWVMSDSVIAHPDLMMPYLKTLLDRLEQPLLTDTLRLNICRALQYVRIPEALQGQAAEILFGYLGNPDIPAAPRAFGMTTLANICRDVPELAEELRLVIEEQWPVAPPAFKSRGRKILAEIKKISPASRPS